jgi:hypothetical protein
VVHGFLSCRPNLVGRDQPTGTVHHVLTIPHHYSPTAPTLGTFPQVRALSRFFCDIGHTSQNRHDNAVEILSLQVRACFWCRRRIICTDSHLVTAR